MSNEKILTPEFRVSYPSLFQPAKPMAGSTNPGKYEVTMLFPKDADLSALKAAAKAAVVAKWGANPPKGLRSPFRDGDEKETDGYAGCIFVKASSKEQPGVVDGARNVIKDPNVVYAGSYARATVRAYVYEAQGNRGVAFGLQNLQFLRDGEPFGVARTAAEDDFDAVAGAVTAAPPKATDDDFM